MEYYIQNTNAGYLGNSIIFWAKNNMGYTSDLNNCHKFTEQEAKEICNGNPDKNKAWPVDYIDSNQGVQRVIGMSHLDKSNIKIFDK